MKLISYFVVEEERDQLAVLVGENAYNMDALDRKLPNNMAEFLWGEDETMVMAKAYDAKIKAGEKVKAKAQKATKLPLLAPIPYPTSLRYADAFSQANSLTTSKFPDFQFANHHTVQGGGAVVCMSDHLQQLDFGLEIAAVIGLQGYNIRAEEAEEFIAGYMVMNNFSARHFGGAKGADFATAVGPYLVTPDELSANVQEMEEQEGYTLNLPMRAWVNGQLVTEGNTADMIWTFSEIIERCSYGIELHPGAIISSGTIGKGSFWALHQLDHKKNAPKCLKVGDRVELSIDGLGKLSNYIELSEDKFSILK